jgi:hypothetical protein
VNTHKATLAQRHAYEARKNVAESDAKLAELQAQHDRETKKLGTFISTIHLTANQPNDG